MDLISRQAAIDAIYEHEFSYYCPKDEVSTVINDLPSAQKKGEWNKSDISDDRYVCSVCCYVYSEKHHFCPHCGADMRESDD